MSFQSPLFLLALLAVPVVALLYVQLDRRRRRASEAFAAPRMVPSVAPSRPGWRRHLPMVLYAAALTALALAVARPQASVAVPRERASVILATDQSGSMAAKDVQPSRLEAARRAAGDFLDGIPRRFRVGAVAFSNSVQSIEAPTTDREQVRSTLDALSPKGGTAAGEALATSLDLLEPLTRRPSRQPPAAIVLISDGASTHGRDPLQVARAATKRKIPIHTVSLGTDAGTIEVRRSSGAVERRSVPPDRETLRRIAGISGGEFFSAANELELDRVYEKLGSQITTVDEWREITAVFVAAAAMVLLTGGVLSLRWFGRLP
jgi:Ca-activated chloride channel family protein